MGLIVRSLRQDGRPIIDIRLTRKDGSVLETKALIDTGTDFCHIPPELLDQTQAEFIQDITVDSHGNTESLAKLFWADITFPNGDDGSDPCSFRTRVINTGAITAPMIVGMECISMFDFTIKRTKQFFLDW